MKLISSLILSFALITPINTWACKVLAKHKTSIHATTHVAKHVAHSAKAKHTVTKVAAVHHSKIKDRYKLVTYYVHGKKKHKFVDTHHGESIAKNITRKHGLVLPEDMSPATKAELMAGGHMPSQAAIKEPRAPASAFVETSVTQNIDLDNDVPPPKIIQ